MVCRDVVEFHEVGNFWVGFDLSSSFGGLSPGGMIPWVSPFSSFPRVSPVFGRVTSLLVTDETLSVPDVFCSFTRREIDLVYIHSIGVRSRGLAGWLDVAVPPSSEFPESYHVSVELSGLVKPLLPFPTGLGIRECGSGHHDSKLLGYSSLEGIHQDAVIIDPTTCLGQFEGSGVFVEISIKLVHAEGINSLAGSVFEILWDKHFFKGFA